MAPHQDLSTPLLEPSEPTAPPLGSAHPDGAQGSEERAAGAQDSQEECPSGAAPVMGGIIPAAGVPCPGPAATVADRPPAGLYGDMRAPRLVLLPTRDAVPMEVMTCGCCRKRVVPVLMKEVGLCNWLVGLGCLLLCWPCAWVPCVVDGLKDSVYRCSACGNEIWRINR